MSNHRLSLRQGEIKKDCFDLPDGPDGYPVAAEDIVSAELVLCGCGNTVRFEAKVEGPPQCEQLCVWVDTTKLDAGSYEGHWVIVLADGQVCKPPSRCRTMKVKVGEAKDLTGVELCPYPETDEDGGLIANPQSETGEPFEGGPPGPLTP